MWFMFLLLRCLNILSVSQTPNPQVLANKSENIDRYENDRNAANRNMEQSVEKFSLKEYIL